MPGRTCSFCQSPMASRDSVERCRNKDCRFVGWGTDRPVENVGSGPGPYLSSV